MMELMVSKSGTFHLPVYGIRRYYVVHPPILVVLLHHWLAILMYHRLLFQW